jgi:uncharacterized membrane protein (DUF4010 family)
MMLPPPFADLALALALGLLIGIERGWRMREEPEGARVAGVRTFGLLGLTGGAIGTLIAARQPEISAALAAGAIGALLLGHWYDMRRETSVSATSAIAAVLTLGLGVLAGIGQPVVASVSGGAATILLASRRSLHAMLKTASEEDIRAMIRLTLIAFVILPLLPDRQMGPFDALNPWRLWFVIVVIGVMAFAGYVLSRAFGARKGVLITGAVGAFVSSTAVTVDCARRLREGTGGAPDEAAVAIASLVMMIRVLVLSAMLAPPLVGHLAFMLSPAIALAALAALWLLWRAHGGSLGREAKAKPPGLALAFGFALLVAIVSVAAGWAATRYGTQSAALAIAIGGVFDVDSAIAAVGALRPGLVTQAMAVAIAVPVLANSLFKLALLGSIAGPRKGWRGCAALAAVCVPLAVMIARYPGALAPA